jgi:hypothetical protein
LVRQQRILSLVREAHVVIEGNAKRASSRHVARSNFKKLLWYECSRWTIAINPNDRDPSASTGQLLGVKIPKLLLLPQYMDRVKSTHTQLLLWKSWPAISSVGVVL